MTASSATLSCACWESSSASNCALATACSTAGVSATPRLRGGGERGRDNRPLGAALPRGGGAAPALSRRYYGEGLPEAVELTLPGLPAEPAPASPRRAGELRILYCGELSR